MCSLEYNFAHSENANTYEKRIGTGMLLPGHAFEGHTDVVPNLFVPVFRMYVEKQFCAPSGCLWGVSGSCKS